MLALVPLVAQGLRWGHIDSFRLPPVYERACSHAVNKHALVENATSKLPRELLSWLLHFSMPSMHVRFWMWQVASSSCSMVQIQEVGLRTLDEIVDE